MNIEALRASIDAEDDRHNDALAAIAEDLLEREVRPFCIALGWGFGSLNNNWWFTERGATTHEQRFRKAGDLPENASFERVCAMLSAPAGYGQDIGCFLHGTHIQETP